jgi:hypothetical protein
LVLEKIPMTQSESICCLNVHIFDSFIEKASFA